MKRILSRSLVLSLCLLLPLLVPGCVPSVPNQLSLKQGNVQSKGAPGFIAVSESRMTWADAKAFCQRQGGRLPRFNNSDSWAWNNRNTITHIDGFGALGAPWPSGLPSDGYWTGTEVSDYPGSSWVVGYSGYVGNHGAASQSQSVVFRVVCVP